ncbi:MAG: SPOR domain-containing protein [Alphaproteobacteria bacterium]
MSQNNQFHQYGYDHYLKAPQRPSPTPMRSAARSDGFSGGMRSQLVRKIQSPAVATVALLAAGAMFVGVIYATYPSGDNVQTQIPIVKADLRPIKTMPEHPGGMDIPHRESTILAHVGQSSDLQSAMPEGIENLLVPSEDELMSKEQEITQAMASFPGGNNIPMDAVEVPVSTVDMQSNVKQVQTPVVPSVKQSDVIELRDNNEVKVIQKVAVSDFDIKEPSADNILQKIGTSESAKDVPSSEFNNKVASAAVAVKPSRHSTIHAAGTSPETIDFVRSVLNDKSSGDAVVTPRAALSPARIEPAAGADSPAANITGVAYFVQLASITDPARAGKEWTKMQAKYGVLSASQFRVQEASLSKGTFYRIQAGPMSKAKADELCHDLKALNKPGGCLVVK